MIKSLNNLNELNNIIKNKKLTLVYFFPENTNIVFYELLEIINIIYKDKLNCYQIKINDNIINTLKITNKPEIRLYKNNKYLHNLQYYNLNNLYSLIIKNI